MDVAHEHYYGNGKVVQSVYVHAHGLPAGGAHEHEEYYWIEMHLRLADQQHEPRKRGQR